jgi:hypothetical protein
MNRLRDYRQRQSPHRNDIDICQFAGRGSRNHDERGLSCCCKARDWVRHNRYGLFGTVVPI